MATAKQKRWIDLLVKRGCVATGEDYNVQVHHIWGRKAKSNKVAIGEWAVNVLSFDLHDVSSNHPHNVTHHRHCFEAKYGTEKSLFLKRYYAIKMNMYEGDIKQDFEALPPMEVIRAIEDYQR